MKNYLMLFLIGMFIFSACSETSKKNEENKSKEESPIAEGVDEKAVEKPTAKKSVYFEDYAKIKNKEALLEKFGASNIKNSVEGFAEGTIEKEVSLLTDPENRNVIKFVWDEDNTLSWIEASENLYDENYEITGKQSIKTETGLWLGMSLADLRKWNEADFKFSGFGWDFGGGIFAEKGSKIADSPVSLTLNYSGTNIPDFAMGDVELYADDERLKNLEITVSNFMFYNEK